MELNTPLDGAWPSGVKKIALFGSFARCQEGPESDIDILVV
ncbi:MAG: nucleotidyltransferase domain-containing protein [Actinomycetota bacterium]